MTIIRIQHQNRYTCIANIAIRDKRLSFKARGLHHLLLSYPDNWQVNIKHLVNESDKDGKDAVASGLKELEALGYLQKCRVRNDLGRFVGWEYVLSELPMPKQDPPDPAIAEDGKPENGFSETGFSERGKSGLLISTDRSTNTDLKEVTTHTKSACDFSEKIGSQEVESLEDSSSPEVKNVPRVAEKINAPPPDPKPAPNPQHSAAARCEAYFQNPRPAHPWLEDPNSRSSIKPDFVKFILKRHLSRYPDRFNGKVTEGDAKRWIIRRCNPQFSGEEGVLEVQTFWEEFLEANPKKGNAYAKWDLKDWQNHPDYGFLKRKILTEGIEALKESNRDLWCGFAAFVEQGGLA